MSSLRMGLVLVLVSMFPFSVAAQKESIASMRKQAVTLAIDVLNPKNLQKSVALCERILEKRPNDFDTLVLYSRVCWSLGNHQSEREQQSEWFERGREVGKTIKEIYPDRPEGYYWFGVNYGEWVDRASIFAKIGAKKVILENMNKVLELDPKYDAGGAYIAIGRINYIAPGGSYEKAIEYYQKAIVLGPKRTTPHLYLGELYLHEHIFDKAEKALRQVLTMEVDPRYAIEARDDRIAAAKLRKKLIRKEDNFPEQETLTGH